MRASTLPALAAALLLAHLAAAAAVRVSKLERTLSLKPASFVHASLKIAAASQSGGEVAIVVSPEAVGGPIAQAECALGANALNLRVAQAASGISLFFTVPAGDVSVACEIRRTGGRRPLPASILQNEHQKFLFEGENVRVGLGGAFVLEGEEKTTVLLPSTKVESYTETIKPVSVSGRAAVFGPYTTPASAAGGNDVLRIHYEHDTPVPVATSVEREIEISHYGNVAVEEFFDLRHAGAKLKGSFSRLEHQYSPSPNVFQELTAVLPVEARDVYYRDAIGNVTSSHLRVVPNQRQDLELSFRFPLFGGWHIEWYQGYNVPLSAFVSSWGGNRYQLECDFVPPFKSLLTEKLIVKVVLPAGASEWKVESPSVLAKQSEDVRFAYLDVPWAPRTVLILEAHNVIAEGKPLRLRVSYKLPAWNLAEKPLFVMGVSLFCFVVSMVAGRVRWDFDSVAASASKVKGE